MSNAVDVVERLLQVLSVLRAAEGTAVPRPVLVQRVVAYGALSGQFDAQKKLMQNDHKALVALGFQVEDVAPLGEESSFVLRPGPWHLPVDLDPYEQGLLVWVMAAAGATAAQDDAVSDLSGLLGSVPRALDVVQSALASGRALRIVRNGDEVEFEPGQLASRGGRWFVLGRYAGSAVLRGPRLDRMEVLGLGGPLAAPVDIGDPDEVLDPTAWRHHEPVDVELRCLTADLGLVLSWFPRADISQDGDETAMRFWVRNEQALVGRVLGLAGAVRIVHPETARTALRTQVAAVLEAAEA